MEAPVEDIFEAGRVLTGEQPWHFLLEVGVRTLVMFTFLLMTLRMTGKRGVRQLSIFEVVIIIALGSAAGDPMFYEDVGIIPAILVFLVVITMYRFVTFLTGRSKRFEEFIEGRTESLVVDGKFAVHTFRKEHLAQDEFFAELRLRSVEHLGQVRYAFLETNGQVSVFFFDDSEVKPGLPITPPLFQLKSALVIESGIHACAFCGSTEYLEPGTARCTTCNGKDWVMAINTKRQT
jgi:uncharacterized membrane protein YcaP (DUF421 family)